MLIQWKSGEKNTSAGKMFDNNIILYVVRDAFD